VIVNDQILRKFTMSQSDAILERMINFAVQVIKLCSALPNTPIGNHLANQLLRCGTSPAPDYARAQATESPHDLFHQLGLVLKDLNELAIWLEITKRSEMVELKFVELLISVMKENTEITKTIKSSIRAIGN
jgi:four helix bundle protein